MAGFSGEQGAEPIAEVLAGFRRGQGEAIQRVRRWIGAVLHGGNWRFRDPEAVGQEILLKLYEIARADRVQDAGSFQKFVYSVAKNTCVNVYHRDRRRDAHEVPESPDDAMPGEGDPHDDLQERERQEQLRFIFQRLPNPCRQLWDWVYREECSAAEVAGRLGITVNNVRVRVHRCLEKARSLYREHVAWPATDARA